MKHEEKKNQIVIYQPNETIRLEVRLEDNTVWLTQNQISLLFGCTARNVRLHLENIYSCGELVQESTRKEFFLVRKEGSRTVARNVSCYNLDAIISIGYRVNSILGVKFRQWATQVLHDYLIKGYSINNRITHIEDRLDRRLSKAECDISDLKEKVDFFVQTQTPPLQGVFFEGQLWDACSLVEKLIARAKKTILLIDSWVSIETLDMLSKKRRGVVATIVTTKRGNKLAVSDLSKFNTQYQTLIIKESASFHDRFLILDDKEIFLIGASLKDLGKKCFAFTQMDASIIPSITERQSNSI